MTEITIRTSGDARVRESGLYKTCLAELIKEYSNDDVD